MKRIISYVLVLAMLLISANIVIPVSAHQNTSFSTDFTDYAGTWNGTTVTNEGAVPSIVGGSFSNNGTFTEVSGITSGTAADSKYGNSVKVYSAYSETINSTVGAKLTLANQNYLKHSAYFEGSIYAEEPEDCSKTPRALRIHGLNDAGTSSSQINALGLSDSGKITIMEVSTETDWSFDTWYDAKIWVNIDSGEFKVQVYSNGNLVAESQGVKENLKNFSEIRTFTCLNSARTNHPTYMKNKDPQITYFDNMLVKSIYKFEIDETKSAAHAVLDFENFDATSKETKLTYLNDRGSLNWGNSNGELGMELEKVKTDRGYSARIVPWVIGENSEYTFSTTDGIVRDKDGNQVYDRNTMLYPSICYDLKKANYIYDAAYFKTGFKFEDANFGAFNIQVTNYYTPVSCAPNGSISVFGQDSGLDFAVGTWFDVEGVIDLDTGYYTVSLSQEGNSYKYTGTGYVTPVDIHTNGSYTGIYRIRANYSNRAKHNDWSLPTALLVDDMQIGSVSKLKGAVSGSYTFAKAEEAEAFVTTGGASAIVGEALKITGATDGETETTTSMAMPFVNTSFNYKADVNIADLTADRSLVAQNQTAYSSGRVLTPVEIVKLGANGKLYIGGTEVENVTVTAGTYSAEANFDQKNYTSNVTVSKNGDTVAEGEVALGTAAAKIITLDWKVGASTTAVTTLDNVSYSTIFSFEVDENLSTTGDEIEMTAADDVVAKFTNPIDRATFTAETVKVNQGSIAVDTITFVDDYTVKVDFARTQGNHYHVDFDGVADIYGSVASDYIEFDTIRQDLELSAVSFKKGDKALSLVETGEITASITAKANNGTSYDMMFLFGLYQGGKLVKSDFDTFKVTETKEPHTLKLPVPDDGKLYILKAFVWDSETMKPFTEKPYVLEALSEDTKVALVKFDDLNTNNVDKFADIAEWAEDNDIKMNFIFMVNYFDPDREAGSLCDETDLALLKKMYDSPYIELTSHGYYGGTSFFGVSSLEDQLDDFANVKRTVENMGMTITSMAPPNNAVNADTVKAFNQYPEYKALMVRQTNDSTLNANGFFNGENGFATLWKYIDVEAGSTGNTDTVENLKANWNEAMEKGYDYVLLQAHPGAWADGGDPETNMYEFLLWLKSQGVVFMNATEYAEYLMSK